MKVKHCLLCGVELTSLTSKNTAKFCSRTCLALSKRKKAIEKRSEVVLLGDGTCLLPLAYDMTCLVSAVDVSAAMQHGWFASSRGYVLSAGHGKPRRQVRLHRFVMERALGRELDKDEVVDHINGIVNDNRRDNLRVVSQRLNTINRTTWKYSTTGYKGAYWNKRQQEYTACLTTQGVRVYLGRYQSAEEAGWMYDQFAIQIFGEFAKTNFTYYPVS